MDTETPQSGHAVGVIVIRDGRALLLQRAASDAFLPNYWDIPGGKAKAGETVVQAAAREVHEETGLTLESLPHELGGFEYTVTDGRHFVQTNYVGTVAQDTVRLNPREHQAARWFSAEDLDSTEWEMTPETRQTARDALAAVSP